MLLLLSAAFLALLLAAAATGLWHTHSSAAAAAACRVCHVGSTPAVHSAVVLLAPPAPIIEGRAIVPAFTENSARICTLKSPRAPPRAA
jgi:hypothetical protein